MKTRNLYAVVLAVVLTGAPVNALAQASVGSLAEYKKKQDDGIAQAIQNSQTRAKAGKLKMGETGAKTGKGKQPLPAKPAVIRLAVHPRQTGFDNRRRINVR
jgi:hypothetical protein